MTAKKFDVFTYETAEKYVELYEVTYDTQHFTAWYPIYVVVPIGQLSEEEGEACNKKLR